MSRMFLYYVVSIALMLVGLGVMSYEVLERVRGGVLSIEPFVAFGVAPFVVGRLLLWRGRGRLRQIQSGHHAQLVEALARRSGGRVTAELVSRSIDGVTPEQAQKLLEGMAKAGRAEMEADATGGTYFAFDERRQLGA